jgi:hypothetical protein
MVKLTRNLKTGKLEVWKDGKKIGEVVTMGDEVKKDGGLQSEGGKPQKRS